MPALGLGLGVTKPKPAEEQPVIPPGTPIETEGGVDLEIEGGGDTIDTD